MAYRLQKPEWPTKRNRDKLQALVKETLELVRSHDMLARLRRMEALEKAQERLETLRDRGTREAKQRLETVFFELRRARQGR